MELTGGLTGDAVVKTLPDERQVVNFSIAINDYVKRRDEKEGKEFTLYISCSYWKSTGVASKLLKGTIVEVSGRMYVRAYMGTDSEPKASLNLHCNTIKVHGSKGRKESDSSASATDIQTEETKIENIAAITEPAEDLPF